MTTALKVEDPIPAPVSQGTSAVRTGDLHVIQADRDEPLSKCVQNALETYLHNMGGHAISDLHRLVIEEVERPLFETVLCYTDGNLTLAARILGLTRSTLRKRLVHFGIERGR
jgi:Fis family transcriptional regulator